MQSFTNFKNRPTDKTTCRISFGCFTLQARQECKCLAQMVQRRFVMPTSTSQFVEANAVFMFTVKVSRSKSYLYLADALVAFTSLTVRQFFIHCVTINFQWFSALLLFALWLSALPFLRTCTNCFLKDKSQIKQKKHLGNSFCNADKIDRLSI